MKTTKLSTLCKSLLAILLLTAGASLSHADTLVGYNFAGLTGPVTDYDQSTPPNATLYPNVAGAELTVSPNTHDGSDVDEGTLLGSTITRGANYGSQVQNGNGYGYFSQNSIGIQTVNNVFSTTVSGSIAAGNYVQLTLTKGSTPFAVTGLTFGGGSQGGVTTLGLAYSLNGGATFSTVGIPGGNNGIPAANYTGGAGDSGNPYLATVNLSSIAALQEIHGSVTFDLVLLNVGAYQTADFSRNNGGTAATLDDLSVAGGVIPEPTTWSMLIGALALLGMWKLRRRAMAS